MAQAPESIELLELEYCAFLKEHNLEDCSAEDHLMGNDDLTAEQRAYLERFIERWKRASGFEDMVEHMIEKHRTIFDSLVD